MESKLHTRFLAIVALFVVCGLVASCDSKNQVSQTISTVPHSVTSPDPVFSRLFELTTSLKHEAGTLKWKIEATPQGSLENDKILEDLAGESMTPSYSFQPNLQIESNWIDKDGFSIVKATKRPEIIQGRLVFSGISQISEAEASKITFSQLKTIFSDKTKKELAEAAKSLEPKTEQR